MREEQIKKGVEFVLSMRDRNVPLEEQKKFLESKLTEEEITEAFKRLKQISD